MFSGSDEKGYKFLIGTSGYDARNAMNALKEHFTCRGGGSKEMVQGQISGEKDAIEAIFRAM